MINFARQVSFQQFVPCEWTQHNSFYLNKESR